jgi:succinate dehydrogenase / fumarate reductase flavoprotein subunit
VVKSHARLEQARATLADLRERYSRMRLSDTGAWTNQNLAHARAVGDMLVVADAIIEGSFARRESRGSHYRTDFTERDDANFLATTVAKWDAAAGRSRIDFLPVNHGLVQPRKRTYGRVDAPAQAAKPAASSVPAGAAAR